MAEGEGVYRYEGLNEADIKKARKELNENPDKVVAQVASLRRWVKSMKHLTCRTDDVFLLRFLRTAKFEQSRAQQLLDNFCTVRASPRGCPDWFKPMPMDSPQLKSFLEMPQSIMLGQNDNGEVVMYSSMAGFDMDAMSVEDFIRCAYMKSDVFLSSERAIIHGARFVADMKGSTMKQFEKFRNPKMMFQMMRNMQDAFPLRVKAIIYFNEPTYLDLMLAISLPLMKEKLRRRIMRCSSDLEKLKKAVGPGAERLLPPELGGNNKSVAELMAENTAEFISEAANRERQLLSTIEVDESKREPDTRDYLKSYDKSNDAPMGIKGTFTKLNVD